MTNLEILLRHKYIYLDSPTSALLNGTFPRYDLGDRIYMSVCTILEEEPFTVIDIRLFENGMPTYKGIQLNISQLERLLTYKCCSRLDMACLHSVTKGDYSVLIHIGNKVFANCRYKNATLFEVDVRFLLNAYKETAKGITLDVQQIAILYSNEKNILKAIEFVNNSELLCKNDFNEITEN